MPSPVHFPRSATTSASRAWSAIPSPSRTWSATTSPSLAWSATKSPSQRWSATTSLSRAWSETSSPSYGWSKSSLTSSSGALVCGSWVPQDVWTRLASFIQGIPAQHTFQRICRVAAVAIAESRRVSLSLRRQSFRLFSCMLPEGLADKVLMIQPVPPGGSGLLLFVDESETGSGIEIAWLKDGRLVNTPLGLDTVPASAVTNIRFAPNGTSVAMLVTLAHGALLSPQLDPLRRLRGWPNDKNASFSPCEDCTVQVVDLEDFEDGRPGELIVHTFSHVFVPEYGFDMLWRGTTEGESCQELAFAAMLHSDEGAATYLVRWRTFRDPEEKNFIFMACIEGASKEMVMDKREAMRICPTTICTSSIELAKDAKHIFFDTMSKFGILRFDQVDEPSKAKVTRADLPNNPISPLLRESHLRNTVPVPEGSWFPRYNPLDPRLPGTDSSLVGYSFFSGESSSQKSHAPSVTRISRMSPDGSLLCSIVDIFHDICKTVELPSIRRKQVEMRSSSTGRLIYRKLVGRAPDISLSDPEDFHLDKSGDLAHNTLFFSDDSSLVVIWDTLLTKTKCRVFPRLPLVLDARSGNIVQDFKQLSLTTRYETMQMSPDGQTIFGTRMREERIVMDAVDILTGTVLKTVTVTGRVHRPYKFSSQSVYLVPNRYVHTVLRGHLDVLWESSRGSAGCGWTHLRDPDTSITDIS